MVTFEVDDVTPAAETLPTQPLGDLYPEALVVGGDPGTPVLEPTGVHPLLSAVGRAFAEHRPLVLSPDAVWLTITQGVAQHIRLHAEELRPRLVGHTGRKRLSVTVDGPMPCDPGSWRDMVDVFGKLLAAEANATDVFECDFSTSTDVERVAGRVVMLDAYSPYFALWTTCVCGIPSITLTGTAADWQKIRARVDTIATFGLEKWCRSLAPIMDHFVRAASGDVDRAFWQRIYNPVDAYGGDVITGWAARFYPYLEIVGALDWPNPLLELSLGEPRDLTTDHGIYHGPGIRSNHVPATLSRVVVNVNDQVEGDNRVVALHAGMVGVAQDDDGALRPVAGWHLTSAAIEIDDVIDRIIRDHVTTPPREVEWQRVHTADADVVALYHRIGSATLFNGSWRIMPFERQWATLDGPYSNTVNLIIELADGRMIGSLDDYETQTTHWIACHVEEFFDNGIKRLRLVDDPSEVPVYGTSLAMLLDAALDAGGDIAHLETGRLDQVMKIG